MTIDERPLGSGWIEPESAANVENKPEYPYNKVTETESGHLMEFDDTPNRERVRLQHRSGTFIEMHPNGDEVHKVYGDGYEVTFKDKNVEIKGHCSITVGEDCLLHVKGNLTQTVDGDYTLRVGGSINWISENKVTFFSKGNMKLGSGGEGIPGNGALRLYSNDDLTVQGSLRVDSDITADTIVARLNVDAGVGITSGPLGFVTTTGGISVGIPVAVPGAVLASTLVSAPLGNFGIMTAVLMTDIINTNLHNTHIHIAPLGPTSTPIAMMI